MFKTGERRDVLPGVQAKSTYTHVLTILILNVTFRKVIYHSIANEVACNRFTMSTVISTLGYPPAAFRGRVWALLHRVTVGRQTVPWSARDLSTVCECEWPSSLAMASFSSYGLEIFSIDVFIEEVPKEVQGTDIGWERNAFSMLF